MANKSSFSNLYKTGLLYDEDLNNAGNTSKTDNATFSTGLLDSKTDDETASQSNSGALPGPLYDIGYQGFADWYSSASAQDLRKYAETYGYNPYQLALNYNRGTGLYGKSGAVTAEQVAERMGLTDPNAYLGQWANQTGPLDFDYNATGELPDGSSSPLGSLGNQVSNKFEKNVTAGGSLNPISDTAIDPDSGIVYNPETKTQPSGSGSQPVLYPQAKNSSASSTSSEGTPVSEKPVWYNGKWVWPFEDEYYEAVNSGGQIGSSHIGDTEEDNTEPLSGRIGAGGETDTNVSAGTFSTPEYQAPSESVDLSGVGTTSVEYNAPDLGEVDESQLVSKQLEGLLASESPYLTAARSRAQREANARGLLNTTMAGTAGEAAAIEAALPIATSDAEFLQTLTAQEREGLISGALARQQGDITQQGYLTQGAISAQLNAQESALAAALAAYNAALESGLSAQEAEQAARLSAQEAAQAAGLSAQEAEQQARLSAQEASQQMNLENLQQAGANYRQKIEIEAERLLKEAQLTSDERRQATTAIAAAGEKFITEFNNIQRDSTITDKDAAINALIAAYQLEIDAICALYEGLDIDLGDYPPPWVPEEGEGEEEEEEEGGEQPWTNPDNPWETDPGYQ